MHGDFSRWFSKLSPNQIGILAQEGRVLLEADVNAQTMLGMRWQDLAARAAFGAGIAAIPADAPDSWKVVRAQLDPQTGKVRLDVIPGIAWADGLLVELDGTPPRPVTLVATPLQPPIQTPPNNVGASGTRDAVVLEVWRRALNGYQVPADLIEPALGGPDTAERVETAYALRLFRLGDGEDCRSIADALRDDLQKRGRLHVTIAPTTTTTGDCPVVLGGGYTGFEHDLYRVEIANVDAREPMFKWSQWNGALVGRGTYDATTQKLTLIAGDQPILRSGLTSFYLEVLVHDTELGGWRVAYGARASLDAAGDIDLSGPKSFGALPPATGSWFVRVWNELRAVSEFPAGTPTELRDGIRLELDQGATVSYVPGDYWTFSVRAGLDNPSPLLDHAAPHGVHHHRVPLAELHWGTGPLVPGAGIHDCRVPLHPLTVTDGCCTYSVGDGITSHGDFRTIQDAINALPEAGGRVCVFPGEYRENVVVKYKHDVEIVGCGPRSKLIAPPAPGEFNPALPALYVLDTSGIRVSGLQVVAGWQGIGMLFEADDAAGTVDPDGVFFTPFLERVRVTDCEVRADAGSGIEVRRGRDVEIVGNRVLVQNVANEWSAITVAVEDARIERNFVAVDDPQGKEYQALGGIWLRGGCEAVDVLDNEIVGGAGHGIMLGHVEQAEVRPNIPLALNIRRGFHGYIYTRYLPEDCVGCGPGDVVVPPPGASTDPTWVAGDGLRDITIRDNSIAQMGISGIGVFGFFTNRDQGIITIENLEISGNRISRNLSRLLADTPSADLSGFGAISLGDVIDLAIRDNEITHNGTHARGGVCGIFVLSGEAVEIARNKIVGNGPREPQRVTSLHPHGGIWLHHVAPPTHAIEYESLPLGRISAALRENEVHAPNGPALVIRGLGHVQVVANAFTSESSQGVDGVCTVYIASNSLAGNVVSNATFGGLRHGLVSTLAPATRITVANRVAEDRPFTAAELLGSRVVVSPDRVIEAAYIPPPGSVLFANNHCTLHTPAVRLVPCSVALAGLVDMELTGNHFHTRAGSAYFPVRVIGSTVRVDGNRFVEQGAVVWSGFAHGIYTSMSGNIADHCLAATATKRVVKVNNIEIDQRYCNRFTPGLAGALDLVTVEVNP